MASEASSTTQAATRLMRMSEVLSLTGIKSRSTVYELQASGDFPQAVRLTGKAIGFVESEVDAWIRSRIEARPAPEAMPPTRPARRYRSATATQTATRPATTRQAASQAGATPATSGATSTATTAPPRRRGPARTRAQRQQGPGK